ncbi:MAG: hypothetical protein HY292_15395 [Planctomycetes bacterium]|nr:hypothetical protein [Planctomycetota bacterium]
MLRLRFGRATAWVAVMASTPAILAVAERPTVIPAAPNVSRQAELTDGPAWQDFVLRNGDWSVLWNEEDGTPRRAMSQGYALTTAPLDERAVVAAVRSFVDQNRGVFRLSSADIEEMYAFPSKNSWVVLFHQVYRGLVVEESQLTFWVTHSGRLGVFEERGVVPGLDLNPTPFISSDDARDILLETTLPDGGPLGSTVTFDEPALCVAVSSDPGVAHLAWKVGVNVDEPPHHFVGYVDAHDSRIVRSSDEIYYVDVVGHADGRARTSNGCSALGVQNLPYVQARVQGGGSAFADASGNFTIPNAGSSPVNVTLGAVGRWASVHNTRGSELSASASFTPGTSSNIRLNPSGSVEFDYAQVDAYVQGTRIHDYIKGITPLGNFDFQQLLNVNIASSCNAYYNGTSTNYYNAGGGCTNTAFDSVVAHETGHWFDAATGGITDGGLSEGIGDTQSMYELGLATIGACFFTGGGGIRDGNNGRQWPASECGGEVHCLGETFMGVTWRIRQNMISSLGAAGIPVAENDTFTAIFSNPPDIPSAVNATFVADDDDGNLSNGVPHLAQLSAAAQSHNFSIPQPPTLQSVSPASVGRCPGALVSIRGTNFVPGASQVRFNGVAMTVTSVGQSIIIVSDAGGGTLGPITVTVSTPFGSATMPNALQRTGEYFLSHLDPAFIGRSFNLRLCGEANANYFVVASLGQVGATYHGIGVNVGPALRTISDSINGNAQPLDATGIRTFSVPVPNLINLLLRHVYFQGYVAPPGALPASLTNVNDVQIFQGSN